MIIERLNREHRNIEKLLAILERELEIFDRGDRPDFEVIYAIVSYFKVYSEELLAKRLSEVNFPAPGGGEALWVRRGRSCSRRHG